MTAWTELDPWMQAALGLVLLGAVAYAARWLAHSVLRRVLGAVRQGVTARWARVLLSATVLKRLAQVVPSLVVQVGLPVVPHLPGTASSIIGNVAVALTVLHLVRALVAVLDALQASHEVEPAETGASLRSIKSYVQLGKLLLMFFGAIVIVAALIDRSPLILLSGLGAMSAVLMLVFKDTILSFVAGVQLASNDLLRVGDWIEMPQVGADGDVIDIALHTVKVQNWDKTITTIPTWRLMSESYRNWRGMSQAGGRRIKRALRIDSASVRFLTPDELQALSRVALLAPYLNEKLSDVQRTNAQRQSELGERASEPANQRRLTNLGTFRAYVQAYVAAHPGIHPGMTQMVRTLEPTSEGVPLEVYCFTATTAWVKYEAIQGDVFDHLIAILPAFGLRVYQSPSGHDLRSAVGAGALVPMA